MQTFWQSPGGRVMSVAHAVFLAGAAAYLLTSNLYIWGILPPAGITLSFVACGLAIKEHPAKTLFAITVLPCALWGFTYLSGELNWRATPWPAYAMLVGAAFALFRAAVPGSGGGTPAKA